MSGVKKIDTDAAPPSGAPAKAPLKPGRHAAGQDPVKREQIIDGAKRVFMQLGFEAASMNDIAAEAGVSKGTLYVYFANKEDLFVQLIVRERGRTFAEVQDILDQSLPLPEALRRFGIQIATRLTSPEVIQAQRTVLGVADRMPGIAARFVHGDPESGFRTGASILKLYLDRQVESGVLKIEDTDLAARQFTDLAMAGLFRTCLFGNLDATPTPEQIIRTVEGAVEMFLVRYETAEIERRHTR